MWTGKGATGVPAAPDSRDLSRTEEISLQAFSARPLPTYAAYSTPMWTRPNEERKEPFVSFAHFFSSSTLCVSVLFLSPLER